MPRYRMLLLVLSLAALSACAGDVDDSATIVDHSYARPDDVTMTHLDLNLTVDFETRRAQGRAAIDIDNRTHARRLHLDTYALNIKRVTLGDDGAQTHWALGDSVSIIGRPLLVDIGRNTKRVVIEYETGDDARGLQWLSPEQTAGKKQPFLYTQSQAILARSWVPCQDVPSVRFTYRAHVHTPPGLVALMSARNLHDGEKSGEYEFTMQQPIPSYLLALAVGDLDYRAISERAGVYAEPSVVDAAAAEFSDMETMIQTAEAMYGPYRWEQYDVLVLPPSFPYGGMENPRMTFVTPVLVAGDQSLVSTIAHELAHSWSGNLVTNATWDDFWLNEGFTTYFERRIMEQLYGRDVSEMHAILGRQELDDEVIAEGADSFDTALYIHLNGRDPDEELGTAPYEKGYLFLRLLEETVGRDRFDAFLRTYFDTFAFQSMTTDRFVAYLHEELLDNGGVDVAALQVSAWIDSAGVPSNAPVAHSTRLGKVDEQVKAFVGGTPADRLLTKDWSTQEWEHFFAQLPDPIQVQQAEELSRTFHFERTNAVVQRSWFVAAIGAGYTASYPAIDAYLQRIGRRYLVRPIYAKLAETKAGKEFALEVYAKARPGYHAVTRGTIDLLLQWGMP